ncbi:MAG: hypothetical protein ABI200_00140 [Gaiellales bacterium]
MATLTKHSISKQAKAIAGDADALKKTARRARKVAQAQAGEARKHAKSWSKQAEHQSRRARKEAEERREELMEKLATGAGIAMSFAPVVARAVMSSKKGRRRVARTAATSAIRLNPLLLGVSVAGAGVVGFKIWKRRSAAATSSVDDAFDEDPIRMQHARMDDEGPVPGSYEPSSHLRVSRN